MKLFADPQGSRVSFAWRDLSSGVLACVSRKRDLSENCDLGFTIVTQFNNDLSVVSNISRNQGHRVSLKPGKGWLRRNFITEVYLPSLFTRRKGIAHRPEFPELDSRTALFDLDWSCLVFNLLARTKYSGGSNVVALAESH